MLRLLSVSLRNDGDANIFRKRFIIERLTSLHGSPLIPASSCGLIMAAVASCIHTPAYAIDLVCRAGVVPWLTGQAEMQLSCISSRAGGTHNTLPDAAGGFAQSLPHQASSGAIAHDGYNPQLLPSAQPSQVSQQ
ncbi:hypothetical protein WJX84_011603 [Apatococcus fuscideae]|uniref:URB1 C-terminal domain-containing protein n=1 Tax=Apatococcus fuscideae TaxID=2026836 RepID=A0AAW1SWF8_9CHLO